MSELADVKLPGDDAEDGPFIDGQNDAKDEIADDLRGILNEWEKKE